MFYDFETTQNTKVRAPPYMCQNLSAFNNFTHCVKRNPTLIKIMSGVARGNTFWDDTVGDLLTYLCEPRPSANKVVGIAHNVKAYNLHFSLNREILLKWQTGIIMSGQKIMSMKFQHLHLLDSVSYLPMALRKLPQTFVLTAINHGTLTSSSRKKRGLCGADFRQ
jgi:hypothetical protein